MKILITGLHSYVGNHVGEHLIQAGHQVEYMSLRNESWKNSSFKPYDVIFHVAGIAHVPIKNNKSDLYKKINYDLTVQLAEKAKKENVNHFIFMSSIMVFGSQGTIKKTTIPMPDNPYGKSKRDAEIALNKIASKTFKVSIIRAPMIYGKNSKGNFNRLRKLSLKWGLWPDYQNKRSMLYIKNLSLFIEHIINIEKSGTYHPQNKEWITTVEMVKHIRELNDKKTYLFRTLNVFVNIGLKYFKTFQKLFGSFYYDFNEDILDSFLDLNSSLKEIEQD